MNWPTWESDDGRVRLICGRCEDVLPTFPRGAFHACVTDPPYGIGVGRSAHKASGDVVGHGHRRVAKRTYELTTWDDTPATPEALALIMATSRWQIIWGGNFFPLGPAPCMLVWNKLNGDNNFADCELAWTNLEKAVRKIDWLWNGFAREGNEERTIHPTQKPVGVMSWCLGHLPKPVTSVIDPYMGSGSTVIACMRAGIPVTAIEEHEPYFAGAIKRIEAEQNRAPLFDEPIPIQRSMFAETA